MKLIRWTRFSWDLTTLAPVYPAIDSHYRIREATAEDEKVVRTVLLSAFTLDSDWNYLLRDLREQLDSALDASFDEKRDRSEPPCLVVTHGSRVIGVSALTAKRDVENNLLTGPWILMEYRNRGLATALLAESLIALKAANLVTAYGLTQQNSPTAEFIYTKFGSTQAPHPNKPDLAVG